MTDYPEPPSFGRSRLGRFRRPENESTYMVKLRLQKGYRFKRPFWTHLETLAVAPPRDEPGEFTLIHDLLLGVCHRHDVRTPAVVAILRTQAYGESVGSHGIGMFAVSESGVKLLKGYPQDKGIPHSDPHEDYWWKSRSQTRSFDVRRASPADPASKLGRMPAGEMPAACQPRTEPLFRSVKVSGSEKDDDRLSNLTARF